MPTPNRIQKKGHGIGSAQRAAKPSRKLSGPERIKADLSKQVPNNSYSAKTEYVSLDFTCRDCGDECVWTAEQQRLYYEEWGGQIYATAVRCRECRTCARKQKAATTR